MAFYATDSELYADLGECLRGVLCDPENADRARAVGSVIRIETVRPQARLTLNLAPEGEPEVLFGDCELRPAAVITMEGDAARGFFLGEVSLIGALSGGKMTAQGPVAPILRVVPLANLVAPRFQEFEGSGGAAPAGDGKAPAGEQEPGAEEEAAEAEDGAEPGESAEEEPVEAPAEEEAPAEAEAAVGEEAPAEDAEAASEDGQS